VFPLGEEIKLTDELLVRVETEDEESDVDHNPAYRYSHSCCVWHAKNDSERLVLVHYDLMDKRFRVGNGSIPTIPFTTADCAQTVVTRNTLPVLSLLKALVSLESFYHAIMDLAVHHHTTRDELLKHLLVAWLAMSARMPEVLALITYSYFI
jgi:hypothetical protein